MKKGLTLLTCLGLIWTFGFTLSSCSKDDDPKPVVFTKEQGWSKEIYANMKEIYLWNDALPATFDPTKYATPEDALKYLIGLKIDPSTNNAIDRYSFLDKIGNLSGEIGGGTASGNYGFDLAAVQNPDKSISVFVKSVYKNSPAGLAGVKRSFEIVKVNGSSEVHPGITSDGYLDANSTGYKNVYGTLYESKTAIYTFKTNDGKIIDVPMSIASYKINSVLLDTVYTTADTKKVGYAVFNQFLGESSVTELESTIRKFETEGVKYVIVDLRYNGGGAVSTCEKFCNMLSPATANGRVMYLYKMNSLLMSQYKSSDLITSYAKTNTLEPTELYFIVGGGTASAAELLINNLKPYYPGKIYLIGKTTYGKPCGFWATPIGYSEKQTTPKEGYDLYAISFETINANGEGQYYSGMKPTIEVSDYIGYAWGDINDPRLAQALYHITNGSFNTTKASIGKHPALRTDIDHQFKGMIDFRRHLK
jgi:C-terminal processing protease CtpA/Prc